MKILSFDVGIVNLAYCIIEKNENFLKILHWEIIELSKKGNTFTAHIATSGIAELYLTLINELDKRQYLRDVDIVLIEKQPSFNPKMRIIAGCLQTYFYIRGVVDRPVAPIRSVEFFSPKHKLKCYDGPELDISSKNGKVVKGKYAQTKKMGVAIARVKLEENDETEWIKIFEKSKKKDDLSDCYLQALTYILMKKPKDLKDPKAQKTSKGTLKKQLKEYLDPMVKTCSVTELMNKEYRTVGELDFPFELDEPIETVLSKLAMKRYINLKFI
jgi:hypothetical protein